MADTKHHPKRILHIIGRLNIGGPTINAVLLTHYLRKQGYDVQLVCGEVIGDESNMQYFADDHDVVPITIPHISRNLNPVNDIKTLYRLYKIIHEMQPDVVHTHTIKAGFLGRIAARMAGVPVIIHTFHSHTFNKNINRLLRYLFIWLERWAATYSDSIITLTESLRQELAEVYKIARRGHITVLPLGMELDRFASTPRHGNQFRQQWNIATDVPLIGTVGRLDPIKNHDLFLQMAQIVKQTLPNVRFVIVGDGGERERLERLTNHLGLQDAVIFTGWQRDILSIYSDFDVNVISSIHEATPVSIIESLASACPVVTTAVGGVPDLLQGGLLGTLVPAGDPQALAGAIVETIHNPPDMEPIQANILSNFGIDRLVNDLDSLYTGVFAKKMYKNR